LDDRKFVPPKCIEHVVQPDNVRVELEQGEGDDTMQESASEDLVGYIVDSAPKIFLILTTIGCAVIPCIKLFHKYSATDKHLGLEFEHVKSRMKPGCAVEEEYCPMVYSLIELANMFRKNGKGMPKVHDFCQAQWQFLACKLGGSERLGGFSSSSVLPITMREEVHDGGGFSHVYKIKMHPQLSSLAVSFALLCGKY
jgi:hypothetical protein